MSQSRLALSTSYAPAYTSNYSQYINTTSTLPTTANSRNQNVC